jgi:hypothetical protein
MHYRKRHDRGRSYGDDDFESRHRAYEERKRREVAEAQRAQKPAASRANADMLSLSGMRHKTEKAKPFGGSC